MTRMLVCVGETTPEHMLYVLSEGIRKPFKVVTMEEEWFEAAAELGLPRYLFKTKLNLMLFVRIHHIICVWIRETCGLKQLSTVASLHAMGAVELPLHGGTE